LDVFADTPSFLATHLTDTNIRKPPLEVRLITFRKC